MYIYNVTINVEKSVKEQWLTWIESHINQVLETGRFSAAKLTEVLVEEEYGAKTYSIQYTSKSREDLDAYYKLDADKLRNETVKKFGEKVLAFRTELKLINEFYPKVGSN